MRGGDDAAVPVAGDAVAVAIQDARVDGIIDVVAVALDVPPLVDCNRDRNPCSAIVAPVAVVPLVMLGIGYDFPVIDPPPAASPLSSPSPACTSPQSPIPPLALSSSPSLATTEKKDDAEDNVLEGPPPRQR